MAVPSPSRHCSPPTPRRSRVSLPVRCTTIVFPLPMRRGTQPYPLTGLLLRQTRQIPLHRPFPSPPRPTAPPYPALPCFSLRRLLTTWESPAFSSNLTEPIWVGKTQSPPTAFCGTPLPLQMHLTYFLRLP